MQSILILAILAIPFVKDVVLADIRHPIRVEENR